MDEGEDEELSSIGIRRYKLQKVLYEHCVNSGVIFQLGKRISKTSHNENGVVIEFEGGGSTTASYLFACII